MDLIYNSSSSSSDSSSPNSTTQNTIQQYHYQQQQQQPHNDGGATVSSATTRKPISETGTATEAGLSGHLKYSTSSTSSSSPSLSASFQDNKKHSRRKTKSTTSHKLKPYELTSSKNSSMSSSRSLIKPNRQAAAAVTKDVADNDDDDDDEYDDFKKEKRCRSRKISSSSSSESSSSSSSHKSSSHKETSNASAAPNRKRKMEQLQYQPMDVEDTEFGYNPPLAKRQQLSKSTTLTAAYSSDSSSSMVLTAYPSPDEKDELKLQTNERSLLAEEIPKLPDSPVPDSRDSPSPSEECELDSMATVQYFIGQNDRNDDYVVDDGGEVKPTVRSHVLDASFTDEASEINDVEDDDEIISETTTSPSVSSSTTSGSHHHGECTPGAGMPLPPNNTNKTNNMIGNNKSKVKTFDAFMAAHYACMSPAIDDDINEPIRPCPLPALSWANAGDVWKLMCKKDEQATCLRNSSMLDQHPGLQPRMRAILLDWLIEVCEVYKLHRETYYLAMDFLDRYLTVAKKIQKTHLQLIGITCLFVAAKAEEIYPPKICEFAYVTDGACTEVDILQHEKLLLQALNWQISPVTAMGWLGVYMQLNVNNHTPASLTTIASDVKRSETNDAFIYPQFSGFEFVHTAQLLDLCSLDIGITNFPYSVIAAAAISHTFDKKTAMNCSGLEWHVIQPCARWMDPFFQVVSEASVYLPVNEKEDDPINSKFGLGHICPNINTDDSHIIQTHTTTMDMFDHVLLLQQQMYADKMKQEASPGTALIYPEGLLTPPASSRKPLEEVSGEAYYQQNSSTTSSSSSSSSNTTVVAQHQQLEGNIVQVVVSQSSAIASASATTTSSTSIRNCNISICQPPE